MQPISATNLEWFGDLEARLLMAGDISLVLTPAQAQENGTVQLAGQIAAPLSTDQTVTIDWGDQVQSTASLPAGQTAFTANHQFLNESPGGAGYTVVATVADLTGSAVEDVTNVAPVITAANFDRAQINENDAVMLTGTFTDPGTLDTHTLVVDWGDGKSDTIAVDPGARDFAVLHQYLNNPAGSPSGVYTATLTLSDDAGATSTMTSQVTVSNVAPVVYSLSIDPVVIDENGVATLNGSFTDPGTLDTHTVSIDWGDGNTQDLSLALGARDFSATHQYLDDGVSGTPSDVYVVNAAVTDNDTGVGLASTTVTVNNVAPNIYHLDITPVAIDENGVATLNGSFTDPGTLDTHTVSIDWGDGTNETLNLDLGARDFTATHQYLDDNPTGTPSDVYTVNVTVTDDDTGTGMAATTVTVNNVAPVVTQVSMTPVVIDENGVATLQGSFTDPGTLDTHTVSIDWGDGNTETLNLDLGARDFTATHQYLDDNPTGTPSDVYTVNVTVTDDDTGMGVGVTSVTVNNVPPVITDITSSAPGVGDAREGQIVTVGGSFTDVGTLDTHTAVIDWGDSTTTAGVISETGGSGTFSGSHAYVTGGIYTITTTLTDDDTGTTTANTSAVITGVGIHDGVLQIIGDDTNNTVHLNAFRGGKDIKVHASFLAGSKFRDMDFTGVKRIEVLLGDGNDSLQMAGNLKTLTVADGGAGNDVLNAGAGPVIFTGGEGNDRLMGPHSKGAGSILIGGAGKDTINSHVLSNDIIVGGTTSLDPNDDALTADFAKGLLDALAIWNGGGSLAARQAQLSGLGATDDGVADVLLGGKAPKSADWVVTEVPPTAKNGHGAGSKSHGKSVVLSMSAVGHGHKVMPAPVDDSADSSTTTPTPTPVDSVLDSVNPAGKSHGNGHGNGLSKK